MKAKQLYFVKFFSLVVMMTVLAGVSAMDPDGAIAEGPDAVRNLKRSDTQPYIEGADDGVAVALSQSPTERLRNTIEALIESNQYAALCDLFQQMDFTQSFEKGELLYYYRIGLVPAHYYDVKAKIEEMKVKKNLGLTPSPEEIGRMHKNILMLLIRVQIDIALYCCAFGKDVNDFFDVYENIKAKVLILLDVNFPVFRQQHLGRTFIADGLFHRDLRHISGFCDWLRETQSTLLNSDARRYFFGWVPRYRCTETVEFKCKDDERVAHQIDQPSCDLVYPIIVAQIVQRLCQSVGGKDLRVFIGAIGYVVPTPVDVLVRTPVSCGSCGSSGYPHSRRSSDLSSGGSSHTPSQSSQSRNLG